MDDLKKFISNKKIKKIRVMHSSFSKSDSFNEEKTWTNFDMESYGAFHGACDLDGSGLAENIAENRVFAKILEKINSLSNYKDRNTIQKLISEKRISKQTIEAETSYKFSREDSNPIMIETEISYTNAIRLKENRNGQWKPFDILEDIMTSVENGADIANITTDDAEDYFSEELSHNGVKWIDLDFESYGGETLNNEYKELLFVRDWLKSKGIDALLYENEFEGKGECIMSLDPKNIKVINSYCLKHLFDEPEADKPKQIERKKLKI